jgi:hypothetical protein
MGAFGRWGESQIRDLYTKVSFTTLDEVFDSFSMSLNKETSQKEIVML